MNYHNHFYKMKQLQNLTKKSISEIPKKGHNHEAQPSSRGTHHENMPIKFWPP